MTPRPGSPRLAHSRFSQRCIVYGVAWLSAFALSTTVARAQQPTAPELSEPLQLADARIADRGPAFFIVHSSNGRREDATGAAVLSRRISLSLLDATLADALAAIAKQTGLRFVYSQEEAAVDRRVSLSARDITVAAALTQVLFNTGVDVELLTSGQAALVKRHPSPPAQEVGTLRGRVVNKASSAPITGATVTLKESGASAKTDAIGRFELTALQPGDYTLTVVALGLVPYERRVTVKPGQATEIEIAMSTTAASLNAVVVTASKTETEIRDVPAAVNVLTSEEIQQAGASNFVEAIKTVPGVSIGSFGENFNSIQMRGLPRFGNENEATLILVDGVPITDARNSAQILTIPIDNIDHIEVVKGPNSSLYGRTAIGGVVNIFTQDPPPEQRITGDLQTGQFNFIRGAFTAAGPVSTGSRAGYLLSWSGDEHESFHVFDPYHKRATSLFGKFTTPLDDATQFVLEANYASNRGGTPTGDPIVNGTRLLSSIDPTFSPYTNLNLPSAQYNEEHIRAINRIRRQLGPSASISNAFGYGHGLWNFVNDGDFLTGPNPGSDTVILFPFTELRQEDSWYDDLRGEVYLGPDAFRNRLLVGGTLDRNTGALSVNFPYTDTISFGIPIDYHDPVFPGPGDLKVLDAGSRNYQGTFLSAYGQDEIAIEKRLRLNVGLRYDHDDISATSFVPGSPAGKFAGSGGKFSPKVGGTYRVLDSDDPNDPQLSVYAQFSKAFRPGNQPTSIRTALDPKNPLAPETITNYEGGIKASVLQNLVSVEASVFDMLRDGIEVLLPGATPGTFRNSPAGKERFKGVETGVTVQPTSPVSLHAFYAYYDGRYEDFTFQQGSTLVNLSGLRVNLSPHHMLDVGGTYDRGQGFGAAISGYYEGDKALDPQNIFILPPFFLLNGRVSYRWRKYTAAISATNILNRLYFPDGEITAPLYAFPGPPRRIIGELGVTF